MAGGMSLPADVLAKYPELAAGGAAPAPVPAAPPVPFIEPTEEAREAGIILDPAAATRPGEGVEKLAPGVFVPREAVSGGPAPQQAMPAPTQQVAPQRVARGGGIPRLPDIRFENREHFAKQGERLEMQHLRAKEAIREQMQNGTIPLEDGNRELAKMNADYEQRKLELGAKAAGYDASLEGRIEGAQYAQQAITENAAATEMARSEAAIAAGGEQAELYGEQGDRLQSVHDAHQRQWDAGQQAVEDAESKYGLMRDELANSKIDPDRLWKRKGVGLKVMAIIGAAIGAFASTMTKTPNHAAQMISDAVDRDIRAQEMDLTSKRAALGAQGNAVSMARAKLGDVGTSRAAAKALVLEQIGSSLEAKKATARSADEAARIEGLQKEIGLQRDKFKQEMGVNAKKMQLAKEAARQQQLRAAMAARKPKGPEWKAQKGWDARFVPGAGVAPDAASAKELRAKVAANREVLGIVREMRALTAQSGKSWDPAARAKAAALESRMLTATNKSEGLGALDNGTLDVLKPRIPKLSSMTQLDSQTTAALDTVEALVKQGQRIKFQSEGVLPTARRPGMKGWEYAVLPGAVEMPGQAGRPASSGVQEGAVQ